MIVELLTFLVNPESEGQEDRLVVTHTAIWRQTVVHRLHGRVLDCLHPGWRREDAVAPGGTACAQELVPTGQVLAVRVARWEPDR